MYGVLQQYSNVYIAVSLYQAVLFSFVGCAYVPPPVRRLCHTRPVSLLLLYLVIVQSVSFIHEEHSNHIFTE